MATHWPTVLPSESRPTCKYSGFDTQCVSDSQTSPKDIDKPFAA